MGLFLTCLSLFSYLLLRLSRLGSVNKATFTASHLSYCQPHTTQWDTLYSPTYRLRICDSLATVYLPPPNKWQFHGLLWVCTNHGKPWSSATQAPGASYLTPSSHWKQCPLQFTHLCTVDEFAVWSSSSHSCEVLPCAPKARRLWCACLTENILGTDKCHSNR